MSSSSINSKLSTKTFDPNSKRELVRHNQHYIEFKLRDPVTISDTMVRKGMIAVNLAEMSLIKEKFNRTKLLLMRIFDRDDDETYNTFLWCLEVHQPSLLEYVQNNKPLRPRVDTH